MKRDVRRKLDRLPPNSGEAEAGILGCILLDPEHCLPVCISTFGSEQVFYDSKHAIIYSALVDLSSQSKPIDIISLVQCLKDRHQIEDAGGIEFISSLPDMTPSSANLEYYIEIVSSKFLIRKLIQTCTDIINQSYDFIGNVRELLEDAESKIMAIGNRHITGGDGAIHIRSAVQDFITWLEERVTSNGKPIGLQTGLRDLDSQISGMDNGDLLILAARPSVGKTSLAINIAENVAESGTPVAVFSLEMSAAALVRRIICSRVGVTVKQTSEGAIKPEHYSQFINIGGKLASAPIFLDDQSSLSILELRARARRLKQKHDVGLIVVDYLQLLSAGLRHENRQQEVAFISRGLKIMAKELSVPVIAVSQLHRLSPTERNPRPRLSDIRESGAVENDADVVLLLWGELPEDENDPLPEKQRIKVIIAKQRNGPTGDVDLIFHRPLMKFFGISPITDADVINGKNHNSINNSGTGNRVERGCIIND